MEMMSRHSEIVGDVKMVRTIHGLSRSRCIYPSMLGSGYMRVSNSQSPETFQRQSLFFQLVLFLFFFWSLECAGSEQLMQAWRECGTEAFM